MHRIRGFFGIALCALAGMTAALAQISTATNLAPAVSEQARLADLEKSLAEMRADLAKLKNASTGASDATIAELTRKIDVLGAEIEAMKLGQAESTSQSEPSERTDARYGLGVSAAKVYGVTRGVSIGGYGEAVYDNFSSKDESGQPSGLSDRVDLLRAVAYLGYKFDDHWVLNTEIEYEHAVAAADTGGEVAVEFAYLDYMHSRPLNVRAGLVLLPMGLVNELHEPTISISTQRPDVEQVILPTTWRELGTGIYGDNGVVAYRAYVTSSLDAAGFTADEGIRGGRQEGSEALAEDWAVTGRLDYVGTSGLLVGVSAFSGGTGQGNLAPSGAKIGGRTTVFDVHADWQWRGLWLRGLYAHTSIAQADLINQFNGFVGDESVGSRQDGWYVQGAYDVLSFKAQTKMSLLPYVRYEQYDTQREVPSGYARNPANDIDALTVGIAYKPIDRLVFKADWQQRKTAAKTGVDAWSLALGYIF
jgi:F0F1-type ATP synthase membrane subunit c/vacuolar-type H+-ATPase subunit K